MYQNESELKMEFKVLERTWTSQRAKRRKEKFQTSIESNLDLKYEKIDSDLKLICQLQKITCLLNLSLSIQNSEQEQNVIKNKNHLYEILQYIKNNLK